MRVESRESREEKLGAYAELLETWNKKINLVAPSTIADLWQRHIEDSKQVAEYLNSQEKIIDVGSGAGLPGMILSVLGFDVTMIESDSRKCVFLEEAARVCEVKPRIINKRVEEVEGVEGVIVARAFAPLPELLKQTTRLTTRDSRFVLLKGENIQTEIEEARAGGWQFDYTLHPSRTGAGFVVEIKNVREAL